MYNAFKSSNLGIQKFSMDKYLSEKEYESKVRLQAKKELIINEEVAKCLDKHRLDVQDEFTDWLYGSIALALHRQFGFGAKRIAKLFGEAQAISHDLIDKDVDHKQVWDMVRDEIGLDITVE